MESQKNGGPFRSLSPLSRGKTGALMSRKGSVRTIIPLWWSNYTRTNYQQPPRRLSVRHHRRHNHPSLPTPTFSLSIYLLPSLAFFQNKLRHPRNFSRPFLTTGFLHCSAFVTLHLQITTRGTRQTICTILPPFISFLSSFLNRFLLQPWQRLNS